MKSSDCSPTVRPSSEHLEVSLVTTGAAEEGEEKLESQPTPPPRKKKLQKQKMKELQQQLAAEVRKLYY